MEIQDKTFNTICRVCLQHDSHGEMVSLVDDSDVNLSLSPFGKALETITKISVLENRFLPSKLCTTCKNFLEEIALFKNRSKNSHRKMCQVIDYSMKKELADDLIKEVIKQYSIFNQKHPDEDKEGNDINVLTEDMFHSKHLKVEGEYSNIKVEVDVENMSQNDISTDSDTPDETDNVAVFLYSIDKLLQLSSKNDNKPPEKSKPKMRVRRKRAQKDLTCNLCQRVLANPQTLKNHMERHGVCRHVCDQCGKGFPVLAELRKHQVYLHGSESNLVCDVCSFKAAQKFELIEHIRLHTGERPFTCEKCGQSFRRNAIYKNHLKSHAEKTIQCKYCPKKFTRRSHMLIHINNMHDRTFLYQCSVCTITFAKDTTVRRHMLVKHGIPKEKQGKVARVYKNTDANYFENSQDEGLNSCLE